VFTFDAFPTLETERLLLRQIVPEDADGIFVIRGDYEVTRLNIGAAYENIERARDLIHNMQRRYNEHTEVRWGVTLKSESPDAPVIGMCGFNYWHMVDRRASVGFDLARAYWQRGIMGEATRAVLRFGFTQMNLNRIEADASAENIASLRLLESLGFRREGIQREQYFDEGAFHDLILLGLLHREWEAMGKTGP
jgi:ribosomal-protein-alanine N-acetyltransferase